MNQINSRDMNYLCIKLDNNRCIRMENEKDLIP